VSDPLSVSHPEPQPEPQPEPYPESVKTDRLLLRRWRAADEEAVVAIWATGDTWRWLRPGSPYDEAQARLGFDRHLRHWDDYGFGVWTVREPPDETVIGWIGASHPVYVPQVAAEVEIGWTLRPQSRGRGLATEGARAACEAAFQSLRVPRVVSLIQPANKRSQAVAMALGMDRERTVMHPQLRERLEVWSLRA
jgi:RimJ/RimL family protein N-acetyltransferase